MTANIRQPQTFEDVLERVNSLGWWQLAFYAIVAYFQLWMQLYNFAVVFFQLIPDYHCPIPVLSQNNWTNEQIINIRLRI